MVHEQFSRKLWISFGIIVASIAIGVGGIYFFSGQLVSAANAIVNARATLDEQTADVANLANLEQQAAESTRYQAAMAQLLPDQYGLVTFTQWFAQEGQQYGVTANAQFQGNVTPSQGSQPGNAQFSFTATGSLTNIEAFMDFVSARTSNFLVAISSFNITSGESTYNAVGQGVVFSR